MVNRSWPLDAVSGAPVYSGRALRQAQVAPLVGGATAGRPLGGRSGIRPGTSTALVTATSTVWAVGAHAGVLDVQGAAEAGPYGYAVDASVTGTVTAANASNPRVDIVYVQLADPAEGDGTTNPGITVGYLAGTAAAVPAAPSAPARSLVLSQINVPRSGGGTPSVSFTAPYTVAAGGWLPISTKAALDLIPGTVGAHATVTDDTVLQNGDYAWRGSSWVVLNRSTQMPWQNLSMNAGWTNLGTYPPLRWRLDDAGNVHLQGQIVTRSGYAATEVFATLPVGARPSIRFETTVLNNGGATRGIGGVLIDSNGNMNVTQTGISSFSFGNTVFATV